ncbi:antA/AntB antirepressor family protein [Sphingomonas sp.]|uniref:antA/AntB antirepressor family protein n=1 Tax=Sphingomonas sp. TaxID=28214 RepID=UPI0035B253C6
MNALTPIPVITGRLAGQSVPLVDARLLHAALASSQDFSTWIKRRIQKYGFELDVDYLFYRTVGQVPNSGPTFPPNGGKVIGRPTEDYFLTLDMAKELAMVERTPRGRQARRYFIACEQQLRQLQTTSTVPATFTPLSRGQRQAVNRQAWVEASGEIYDLFNRRREVLIRTVLLEDTPGPQYMPPGYRPPWAR